MERPEQRFYMVLHVDACQGQDEQHCFVLLVLRVCIICTILYYVYFEKNCSLSLKNMQ